MKLNDAIVKRIQEICDEKSINVCDASLKGGMSPSAIYDLFKGRTKCSTVITIKRFCEGAGITLKEFFDREYFNDIEEWKYMTANSAVAKRITKLLQEKNMSQYRLEQESGIQHGSMQCIMNGRNKTVTLSTIIMLAKGFNMSITEFLDDDIFNYDNLDIEQ